MMSTSRTSTIRRWVPCARRPAASSRKAERSAECCAWAKTSNSRANAAASNEGRDKSRVHLNARSFPSPKRKQEDEPSTLERGGLASGDRGELPNADGIPMKGISPRHSLTDLRR